jgi:hypothetical protein
MDGADRQIDAVRKLYGVQFRYGNKSRDAV